MKKYITDSRALRDPANTCFVAIKTAADDGHRYVQQLHRAGVNEFIVESCVGFDNISNARFTLANDSVSALQRVAAEHRRSLNDTLVIGITGSIGKTTVKEWLYTSLAERRHIYRSPRSNNSQIGVPQAVLSIDPDDRVAIIEAGISQQGEMARLQRVVRPHIGILTPITDEHAGGFDNIDHKIDEKLLLFAAAEHLIYPDDERVAAAIGRMGYSGALHPYPADDMERAVDIAAEVAGLTLRDVRRPVVSTRTEIFDGFNDCRLIRDYFTPDLETLDTALDFMSRQRTDSRTNTVILTDIDDLDTSHTDLWQTLSRRGINRYILIGRCDRYDELAGEYGSRCRRFASVADFMDGMSTDDFDHELILTFGHHSQVDEIVSFLERQQHETVLDVNLNAVVHNFNLFRSLAGPEAGIICMLKADGYGAGSYQLARTLQSQGAAYIAVAVVDEGVQLRKEGITMPLIVLNPRAANTKTMFEYRLEPEVYSMEMLREFSDRARKAGYHDFPIHLKFDTGMHRLGFGRDDIPEIAQWLAGDRSLRVSTIFSHLATADCPDMDDYTMQQLQLFDTIVSETRAAIGDPAIKAHILNSTGIFRYPGHRHQLVRLGIGLYGQPTIDDGTQSGLQPISTLSSPIISIKSYRAGQSIGYSRRGMLHRDSIIATVPIGYADGLNRGLGNGGASFYINGRLCPIVGNVCMDICMVDVTELGPGGCAVGDRCEVFGPHVPVSALSRQLGTITYEILTWVSPRVKRVYYRE